MTAVMPTAVCKLTTAVRLSADAKVANAGQRVAGCYGTALAGCYGTALAGACQADEELSCDFPCPAADARLLADCLVCPFGSETSNADGRGIVNDGAD